MKKPELLSPAGNLTKLKIALEYGADAVYASVGSFSLRARSGKEFDLESFSVCAIRILRALNFMPL